MFKLLYLLNHISYFNKICKICCLITHIQSLKVWLKSVLPWLKYIIFFYGIVFYWRTLYMHTMLKFVQNIYWHSGVIQTTVIYLYTNMKSLCLPITKIRKATKMQKIWVVWGSVVRYPRYLGKYRDTTCDDTSIAKVTVNRGPTIP